MIVETIKPVINEAVSEEGLSLYGLSNVPYIAKGEKLIRSDLNLELLGEVEEIIGAERFLKKPVSNLVFKIDNMGGLVNNSWVCEVEGFSEEMAEKLKEPKSMLVRFLEVEEGLSQMSGSEKMIEIGFNVGRGELIFKRILLPKTYTDKMILNDEVWLGEAERMPDVFIDIWDKLDVGDYDFNWNERVRNHLLDNVRNLDKKIEYEMRDGQKYVHWDGEWTWAGLLSDANDIERFLAEERKLADLSVGEYLVTEYSHNDGGIVSAGTAGEQEEEDGEKVVGDVQMMGEDGKIHQGAVEGTRGEIGGLVNNLINEMKQEHGFVSEADQRLEVMKRGLEDRMVWIREEVIFDWGEKELIRVGLETESVNKIEMQVNSGEIEMVDWEIIWQSEIRSDNLINIGGDQMFLSESMIDEGVKEIEESGEEWWEGESEDDWEENEPDDSNDNGGGGLGLVRAEIKENNLVNEMKQEYGFVSEMNQGLEVNNSKVEVLDEIEKFNQVKVEMKEKVEIQKREKVMETIETMGSRIEDELVVESKQSEIEPPIWEIPMEPWFDDIPIYEWAEQELSISIVIPTLKVVNEERNVDWAWAAGLVLLVISDTFSQQERVKIPVINGEVMVNRGSGW